MSDDERYEPVPLGFGIEAPPPSYKAAISKKNQNIFKVRERERERDRERERERKCERECRWNKRESLHVRILSILRNQMIYKRQSQLGFLHPHHQQDPGK